MSQGRAFPAGSRFLLGRQALLILDGCLWMLAGAAVVWLGLRAYGTLPRVGWVRPLLPFLLFQGLDGPFLAVTWKETRRIRGSAQPARRPIWQALAGKSWLVLAGSVGGSLWLWRSGWVPAEAAAVICTALGGALALAGVLFWVALVRARRRAARGLPHAFAVEDMWTAANRIIKDVYTKIAGVSTVLAGLMSAVAIIGAKMSGTQQKADQAWDWLKRVWLAWVIINGIGAFIAYVRPLFNGLATLN